METEQDEALDAKAALYTQIECPHCGEYFEEEGDAADDKIDCPLCHKPMVVRHT